MPELSVVVPVYNERDNIPPLLDEIVAVLRGRVSFEIVYVDDASEDDSLEVLKGANPFVVIISICAIVCLISEFASNIASIQLAIPVMIALQKNLDLPPIVLMMPATFAASLGFMLPVATAANTIVFGTKQIDIKDMFRVGIVLDFIGIVLISVFCYLFL